MTKNKTRKNNKKIIPFKKKKNVRFSKKVGKKDLFKKKVITVSLGVAIFLAGLGGVEATISYIDEKKQEKIEMQKLAEAKRLEEERRKKEEEEAKKRMVGVNHEAKKYTYDAKIVEQKLKNYDYSNNGEKVVFLTFDDGSSTTVTPQILDILKQYDVRATFFVAGQNIENGGQKAKDLIKQSFEYGNAIANHSYSHDYKYLYPGRSLNLENFINDFKKNEELLKEILGPYFSTRVIRCPGGSMSWKDMDPLYEKLDESNSADINWNALSGDAEGGKKTADELVQRAIKTSEGKEMVVLLMHDTYGKEETAKALPRIIEYFKDNGYIFKTLS